MADEAPQSVDFWSELEEAHQTVEQWPEWQQRYEADVNADPRLNSVAKETARSHNRE
jgi:hypothetical protein